MESIFHFFEHFTCPTNKFGNWQLTNVSISQLWSSSNFWLA